MNWKKALLAVGVGFLLGAIAGAGFGAARVWLAASSGAMDPMMKSQLLADAIAEAMNSAVLYAFAGVPTMLAIVWVWTAYRARGN